VKAEEKTGGGGDGSDERRSLCISRRDRIRNEIVKQNGWVWKYL